MDINLVISELYHTPLADLQKLHEEVQKELAFRNYTPTAEDIAYEQMAMYANQD